MIPDVMTFVDPFVFDDFFKVDAAATNGLWLATKGTGGALALDTVNAGTWIKVPSAATDNDYQLLSTPVAPFRVLPFVAATTTAVQLPGTSIRYKARFKLTEANVTAANFVFGLSSVLTTGFVADNGAGVPASFSGAVIYKVDGGTSLLAASSNGTTQTTAKTLCAFTSGTTYSVSIQIDHFDDVTARVTFEVFDEVAGVLYQPKSLSAGIGEHKLAVGGLAAMYPIFGVKAGSATAETLIVDYVWATMNRI
jgi:hypothetical protein